IVPSAASRSSWPSIAAKFTNLRLPRRDFKPEPRVRSRGPGFWLKKSLRGAPSPASSTRDDHQAKVAGVVVIDPVPVRGQAGQVQLRETAVEAAEVQESEAFADVGLEVAVVDDRQASGDAGGAPDVELAVAGPGRRPDQVDDEGARLAVGPGDVEHAAVADF